MSKHSNPVGDANEPQGKAYPGKHREVEPPKRPERKVEKADPKDHPHGGGVN